MNAILWLALAFSSDAIVQPGEACRPCHAGVVDTFRKTGMGRSINLRPTPAPAAFYHRKSNRHYTVSTDAIRRHQIDSDGAETNVVQKSITFAIGSGNHASTFIHKTPQGRLLELPLSWYRRIGGYAMSPGYDRSDHHDFRREISDSCLFCHSGGPDPRPIDCGRCHGSTEAHLKSPIKTNILNPARLEPRRQLDVCLQCHLETASRGITDSLRQPGRAVWSFRPGEALTDYKLYFDRADSNQTDRFEINHAGYRLLQSACFKQSEGKLVCTTCHDPHSASVKTNSCTQCHASAHKTGPPVKAASCESCHMPKRIPIDAVHTTMTDHKIVRRPRFSDPVKEDHAPYMGPVVSFYGAADELSLALVNVREGGPDPVPVYRRVLQRSPDDVPVLTALGKALLRRRQPGEAVAVLEKALRLKPANTDARTHLAVAQALLGKHQTGLAELRRAVADYPDDALAWTNLGITLDVLGEGKKAWEAYSEAIRLQPDAAEARRRRAQLKR